MTKKIRLLKLTAEKQIVKGRASRPGNYFMFCLENDTNPEIIKEMDDTPENRNYAIEWLNTKRSTCKLTEGFSTNYYSLTAYAIEYFEVDEDDNFVNGSDYDAADDERYEVVYQHWVAGSGYSHSETVEWLEEEMSAEEYYNNLSDQDIIVEDGVNIQILDEKSNVISEYFIGREDV